MPLPASFAKDGFLPANQVRGKLRRLLVGTDGWPNTGKTEFALSAPGPGVVLCLDRGFDGVFDNPHPPKTRNIDNFAFKVIPVPLPTQLNQNEYLTYWKLFYAEWLKALANPDVRTVVLDGDSDSWELQRLAEFGKITQVPPLAYVSVNAARRAMIARAWDSGKIVIGTNKLSTGYETKLDANNKEVRVRSGHSKAQGFPDVKYLWHIRLRHKYNKDTGKFGVKIMECKADTELVGMELWGEECNFRSLVETIYPNVDPKEWGYK